MSTGYIIRFVLMLTFTVALVLAGMFTFLKDVHDQNEAIFEKRGILKAVSNYLEKPVDKMSDEEVQSIFEQRMEQRVVDHEGNLVEGTQAEDIDMAKEKKKATENRRWPLYVFDSEDGKIYIVSVRGSGLWDEIWGNIAIKEDFNTIAGVTFDHKAETPGLGAEIKDNPAFPRQFVGKELYNEQGEYVSVTVRKGGARDPNHEVDGISGATVTSDGVTKMLDRGIAYYQPYFEKINEGKLGMLSE